MFQLDKHEASMTNCNTRIERHGDERVLAADILSVTPPSRQSEDIPEAA